MEKLVSINELSKLTGLSVSTIRRRMTAGTLPYTRSTNSPFSKTLFYPALVQEILRREAYANFNPNASGNRLVEVEVEQWVVGAEHTKEQKEAQVQQKSYLATLFQVEEDEPVCVSATFTP